MASAEPAGASSSPSAKLTILSLKRDGALGCLVVGGAEGSSFFVREALAPEDLLRALLGAPLELDESLSAELVSADSATRAYGKALSLLEGAEHGRSMLAAKLAKRGYGRDAAKRALDLLEREGYLDDERFARAWLESRLRRKAEGRRALEAGLFSKGISREVAARALAGLAGMASPARERIARELRAAKGEERDRLVGNLRKAGFSSSEIRSMVEEEESDELG